MAPLDKAFIAANRFGLGSRPGQLRAVRGDPRGWLLAQLEGPRSLPGELKDLSSAASRVAEFLKARKQKGDLAARVRRSFREDYMREAGLRSLAAIRSETPFIERLVAFWSNHFSVSVRKPVVAGIAGAYEREAIRPHVTGRFADMLRAVAKHPAMLLYLDNARSFGPNSRAGRRLNKGLNENLAREILELHSLGVDGGYAQDDVWNLAMILTGWSLARPGKDGGLAEGEAALGDLARHPATARHIAAKLARHFIADDPPEPAVARLAQVFAETDGDLAAVTQALVLLDEPWEASLAKLKAPQDLVVSTLRATGFEDETKKLVVALRLLGQAPWSAPSPAGWPDRAEDWASPDALLKRIEFATAVAARVGDRLDPRTLSQETIGAIAERDTMTAISRAPSRGDGLTLLLASAEFQRR